MGNVGGDGEIGDQVDATTTASSSNLSVDPPQFDESRSPLAGVTPSSSAASSPTDGREEMLLTFPLFQRVSEDKNHPQFFPELVKAVHLRNYLPGDVIIQEGEPAKSMFFILRGKVEVISGAGDVKLAELHAGAFFGEIAVLYETTRVATVTALSKCVMAVLTSSELRELLAKYPAMHDLIKAEANERYSKYSEEMEKNGRRLDGFEKHGPVKDSSFGSLKEYSKTNRSSRRPSERSLDHQASDRSMLSVSSRSSSLLHNNIYATQSPLSGTSTTSLAESEEDLNLLEISSVPPGIGTFSSAGVPFISLDREDSMDSDETSSDNEKEGRSPVEGGGDPLGLGLPHPTSYVASLASRHTVRRRASVAVWADDRLMQFAQSIVARDGLDVGAVKNSSALAQDTGSQDMETSDTEESADSMDMDDLAYQFRDLCRLPADILVKALGYLDSREKIRLRILSKSFTELLLCPKFGLFAEVDLSPWHKKIDDDVIDKVEMFCGFCIRKMNLRNCWQVTDKGLHRIAQCSPNLESLNLSSVWDITDAGLGGLARLLTNLLDLDVSNCRKLSDTAMISVLNASPALSSIQMSYCKSFTDSALNHATWAVMKSVNMHRCTGISDGGFAHWEALERSFNMRELILSDCSFLSDAAIKSIGQCCPHLEVLSLSFCCALTEGFAETLANSCPKLEALDLSFCGAAVTDESLLTLTLGLSHLKRLSVRGCVQITNVGIDHLKRAPRLRVVNISQCRNVSLTSDEARALGWTLVNTGSILGEMKHGKYTVDTKGQRMHHVRAITA
ncbi:anaphase-promoting complex subunit Hcn1 [Blyttiomyces sp. JEL0837]|nr:anaphase-promoting complex subunit Hcn1 [Blyttiomyces sp. JEL0837]